MTDPTTRVAADGVSWSTSSPEALRRFYEADAARRMGPSPPAVSISAMDPDGAFPGGLLFTPPAAGGGAVVYLHGGGFVVGSPETHRAICARLALSAGARVLSARYRLAPEHPFPAQRDDAAAALRFAATQMADRVVLAGDSAGAAVALWALDAAPEALRAQVRGAALLYGAFGRTDGDSVRRFGTPASGLDRPGLEAMYARLFPDRATRDRFNLLAAPVRAHPPYYVLAAELDPVLDDSMEMAALAGDAGPVTLRLAAGRAHGFLKDVATSDAAALEADRVAAWIRARLSAPARDGRSGSLGAS